MVQTDNNGENELYKQAEQEWDLNRFFASIETEQQKKLTPTDKRNLNLILLRISPKDAPVMANVAASPKSLRVAFSGWYRLIEILTDQPEKSVTYNNAWRVLASYRKQAALPPIQDLTTLEFIGRQKDITNLANLSRQSKIVLIKAGAGVGKSTLAREFLQTQFKKVIRIEMGLESGNVTPAEEKVSQILRKDFDEEPSRDFGINLDILREKLADRANSIGVLIDNLEPALDENYRFREKLRGYDALLTVLGDRDVFSFTLITSRRSLIAQRVRVHEYSLEGLDITAWRQYFHDCENGADSEALLQMRDAYNGNAKVMDILHGAIKNRFDGNIGAYWSRYKDTLLADSELETLISVEMDWLRDNQPDAYKLLCRMGCYRYQDVKTVPFEGLICLLWNVPESRHLGVVDYLSKTSLIESKGEYYLHPTVREVTKLRIGNCLDWQKANFEVAKYWESTISAQDFLEKRLNIFESFHHYCMAQDYESAFFAVSRKTAQYSYKTNRYSYLRFWGYSPYLASCLGEILDKLNDTSRIHALGTIAVCYYYSCEYELSISYMDQARNYIKANSDYRYQRLLTECLSYISRSYCYQGKFKDGISLCEEALSALNNIVLLEEINLQGISDSVLESQYFFETSRSKTFQSLATIHREMGEYDQSLSYCELAIESLGEYANILYREYGDALSIRSLALHCQNKMDDAVQVMLQAIQNFQVIKDYLSEAYSRCYLVRSYLQVNLEESQNQISMVEDICSQYCTTIVLQANLHSSKAQFFRQKFIKRNELDNLVTSINHHIECIKLLSSIGSNSELAEEYFQIGLTYQAMGEHDQAKEYKTKALELFAQMEAPKQIERVNKAFGGNIQ